ncbi:MAG: DUF2520 domain-containing protein [Acidobacteriota bacterium]|nr:DUF2520 domain-containing protein [Acidobacteriota bacterium]
MRGALAIIGAGRVGRALGRRLHELGWKIGAVVTRNEASARKSVRFIGAGKARAALSLDVLAARLILISTPDEAIAPVARKLARICGEELRGKIVMHLSGALSAGVLKPVRNRGASTASMHPLQSFSGVAVPSLDGKVFAIEGDAAAVRCARQIVRALGGVPVQIAGRSKPLYHAAAAFAAGHVLAIEEAAVQLLMLAGMKRVEAIRALLQLTRQVLDNFERLGPTAAWTGPLARGDFAVIATHMSAMQRLPREFLKAYSALNDLATQVLSSEPSGMRAGWNGNSKSKRAPAKARFTGGKGCSSRTL